MRSFEDVPDALVRSVRAPALIVLGDQDIVKLEHGVELSRLIPGARLLVLPGGHGDYVGEAVSTQKDTRSPEPTAGLIEEFLDARCISASGVSCGPVPHRTTGHAILLSGVILALLLAAKVIGRHRAAAGWGHKATAPGFTNDA